MSGRESKTEEEGEPIDVYGPTARGTQTVESASLSLVVGMGDRADGSPVLVPYVELEIFAKAGDEDEKDETVSLTLSLDNVAFLLDEFGTGLAELMPPLNSVSMGELKPSGPNLEYTIERVESAAKHLEAVASSLRAILPDGGIEVVRASGRKRD